MPEIRYSSDAQQQVVRDALMTARFRVAPDTPEPDASLTLVTQFINRLEETYSGDMYLENSLGQLREMIREATT